MTLRSIRHGPETRRPPMGEICHDGWRDRHLRFHLYERLAPSPRIDDLLHEIDRDPTAILWG